MNRTAASVLVLAAAAATTTVAAADVITQSFSYDWTSDSPQHQFAFDAFDDQGGTRTLTRVSLGFDGVISMQLRAQTFDPAGVGAGEWFVEASHTVVAYFNGGATGGLELLQGIGGAVMQDVTGPLGAGQEGGPGEPFVHFESWDISTVVDIDSALFADFIGAGQHAGFMDGFYDAVVTPPEGGQFIDVFADMLTQTGTVTLTYEYAAAPTPGTLALMGAGGLVVCRRRRR